MQVQVKRERSNFDDVGDFQEKFGLDNVTHHGAAPRGIDRALVEFRIKFMQEELREFIDGYLDLDEVQMADALVDLVFVAMGTAQLMGYPWQELWDDVQAANMQKVRSSSTDHGSERGGAWDVVKPEGWQAPDTAAVLRRHGFEV